MILIESVAYTANGSEEQLHGWRWCCTCHGAISARPWPERPFETSAAAEHDLVVGERPLLPRMEWVR